MTHSAGNAGEDSLFFDGLMNPETEGLIKPGSGICAAGIRRHLSSRQTDLSSEPTISALATPRASDPYTRRRARGLVFPAERSERADTDVDREHTRFTEWFSRRVEPLA